ncbi:MAG TPA: prepilin peptidase [Rhizomicrobium sp.]|jgi:prepilin peptidase CpaA|nr:prepilin peptidase [Rhizomicrobium sp.]
MLAEFLVLIALPLLLAVAAGWDIASFTIPNFLTLALLGAFVVFAFAAGLSFTVIGWHLLAGILGLLIGFTLFAIGHVGGGDAKLFAVMVLWLGLKDLMPYALIASVLGGVLALGLMLMRSWPLPAFLARQAWVMKLHDSKAGIPYGVALAAAAFILLPSTEVFRLAAV